MGSYEPIGELEYTLSYDRAVDSVGGHQLLLEFVQRHARSVGIDGLTTEQAQFAVQGWRYFGSRRGFALPEYLGLTWDAERLR